MAVVLRELFKKTREINISFMKARHQNYDENLDH
jgi:hypothetical protein